MSIYKFGGGTKKLFQNQAERKIVSETPIEYVHSTMLNSDADSSEETFALDESEDLNHLWEEHWSERGEQIILASWVKKYRNYISLEYIENLPVILDPEEVKSSDNNQLPDLMERLAIMENKLATSEHNDPDDTSSTVEAVMKSDEIDKIDQIDSQCNDSNSTSQTTVDNVVEVESGDTGSKNARNTTQQWQCLWNEHYEEQYNQSYSDFISKKRKSNDDDDLENLTTTAELGDTIADDESEYSFINEYNGQLNDLGLPTAFGRKKNAKGNRQSTLPSSTDNAHEFEDLNQLDTKNSKRKRSKKKHRESTVELPKEIANDKTLRKYWSNRFSLFSLFDMGIKLDKESWFSVTPEKIAAYTASRCECDIIIDAFCGAGGNTIQFAKTCRKVIAIDIDPVKIEMAKHNASVYGVADKIEFIVGNYIDLADGLIADAVFLSPPWGGPEYTKNDVYDIEEFLLPVPASKLLEISRSISPNICIYLPRNSNKIQLSVLAGPGNSVEVNQEFLGTRLIAITAYYGDLFKKKDEPPLYT